ncbi:MAG TPA: hypothetical protein VIO15_13210 [Bacteroidales bacterium]
MLKKFLFLWIVCLVHTSLFSQELPLIEKRMYTAPDGKLYIQKSLPVYLMLNTNADNKGAVLLKSERTAAYTNPMYFDTEGLNTIRSPFCVDQKTKEVRKQDIIFEVYADSKAPVTKISFNTGKTFKKDNKLFVKGPSQISLTANDELSGVDKIMYSLDGEEFRPYVSTLEISAEGEHTLKYFAYDFVGNTEALHTLVLVVDNTKPKTSYEFKGDNFDNILAGNASIVLKSEETGSGLAGIYIRLDNGPVQKYSSAIKAATIEQGEHTLYYLASDNLDNAETENTLDFYVDKTPPTIMHEIIGKTYMINGREFSSGRSQLKITGLDNKAGIKEIYYSINNSEYKKYEKPVLLSSISGGLVIKAYALDNVNNRTEIRDEAQSAQLPYIDLTGPSMKYSFSGPLFKYADTIYVNKNTKIHLKGVDEEAGLSQIQYNIDNLGMTNYQEPFSIDKEGIHTIQYSGTDNVDNTTMGYFTVVVDNTGPEIFPRFSSLPIKSDNTQKPIYPSFAALFVAATDQTTGYEKMTYSLNGSKEIPFTGFLNAFNKNNQLTIKAFDKLGNITVLSMQFSVVH